MENMIAINVPFCFVFISARVFHLSMDIMHPELDLAFRDFELVLPDMREEDEQHKKLDTINQPPDSFHNCPGISCPFLELNSDKSWCCTKSGICWGQLAINDILTALAISFLSC